MGERDNSFAAFMKAVESSVDGHAKRKGYTDNDPDGQNKLALAMQQLGIHEAHCIGEIVYKCAEWLKSPRRVLMEKVAGWSWLVWKQTPPDS
jgi:hypothetical protein